MNKTARTILIIALLALFVSSSLACNDYGMTCTIRCQGIEDDAKWEQCMLNCHGGQQ